MQPERSYDVAIVGGGLAGLSAAIQLQRCGHSVILFEKETYPFHKVCGEYISLESWRFLEGLGVPLKQMELPLIRQLHLTAPNGNSFYTMLPLGGFGISRFKLDACLADIAKACGVEMMEGTRVDAVSFDETFRVQFSSGAANARTCCCAYGKRSNLDIKWERQFLHSVDKKLDNYIGVKYHIRSHWKEDLIGLHNFSDGYCGISKIEDDRYCLCYMTKAEKLKRSNNNIRRLEKEVLQRNPHLEKIFSESDFVESFPVTISQINFNEKTQVEDHMLMLGDAAGMITPLCGNGMSIALHTSKIASTLINEFLQGRITRYSMEHRYVEEWKRNFSRRLKTGRMLQRFFGSDRLCNFFVQTFKTFPLLARPLIRMTHGKAF